jgi:hypothetical protein
VTRAEKRRNWTTELDALGYRAMMHFLFTLVILHFVRAGTLLDRTISFLSHCEAPPTLLNSSYQIKEGTVNGLTFQYAVIEMDFDQPLYLASMPR